GADPAGDRGRNEADDGHDRRDEDRPEAKGAAPHDGVPQGQAFLHSRLADRGDEHDAVEDAHAEHRDVADGGRDVEVRVPGPQRERAADQGEGQVQHDQQGVADRLEGAEEQDEDDEDHERHDDVEPRQRPLLVLEAPAPHHTVALGDRHDLHFLHRVGDETSHVSTAYAPLDGDAALIAFAIDLGQPFRLDELGQLHHRDALAVGRADRETTQLRDQIAVRAQADGSVEPSLTLEDLGDHAALGRGLDRILDVLHVDPVPRGGATVHDDLKLGLADEVIVIEVGHAAHAAQNADELAGLGVEHEVVGAVEV